MLKFCFSHPSKSVSFLVLLTLVIQLTQDYSSNFKHVKIFHLGPVRLLAMVSLFVFKVNRFTFQLRNEFLNTKI